MPNKPSNSGRRAVYALIGAPVWTAKRIAEMTGEFSEVARRELDVWVKQGEQIAKRINDRNLIEELSSKVDMDQIQGQVERLRDQLEGVISNWRTSFRPEKSQAPARRQPASTPSAKRPAARKPAAKTTTRKTVKRA